LPVKAKITALVWSGRRRPKEIHGSSKLKTGAASSRAIMIPTSVPTTPQMNVISVNLRTMASSYVNFSIWTVIKLLRAIG